MESSSFPLPPNFVKNPTRTPYPRQLIIYNEERNTWNPTTDENIVAKVPYLAVSYRQSDFPDKKDLERSIHFACGHYKLRAYWLDYKCTGATEEEKNMDLYRIADVFRGAEKTLIMIAGEDDRPQSSGWLSWGDRIWTLPEALLSPFDKLCCQVGTRFVEDISLRRAANAAYKDREEEMMLIDAYSGKDIPTVTGKIELLRKAIWKRSSGPDKKMPISGPLTRGGMFTAYPAERVYALMGFLQYRIIPNPYESEEEAFARLMKANNLVGHIFSWEASTPRSVTPSRDLVLHHNEKLNRLLAREERSITTASSFSGDDFVFDREPPVRPNIFFGRNDFVDMAFKDIVNKHPIRFTILGPGGIGKTAVASAIIDHPEIRKMFDGHRYFIRCNAFSGAHPMLLALCQIIMGPDSLASDSKNPLGLLSQFLSALPKVLVVLDNLETVWHAKNRDGVKRILEAFFRISCLSLVITMRGSSAPENFAWSKVGPYDILPVLELEAAKDTFLAMCQGFEHSPENDADLLTLLRQLDCVPLAISIIAQMAQIEPATPKQISANIMQYLETYRDDPNSSIKASVSLSLESYVIKSHPLCIDVLKIIAYLPVGVTSDSLSKMVPPEITNTIRLIAALLTTGLVHREGKRFNMLSPIRLYIEGEYPLGPATLQTLFEYYFQICKEGPSSYDSLEIKVRLNSEKANCFKVLADAVKFYKTDNRHLQAIINYSRFLCYTIPSSELLHLAEFEFKSCGDSSLTANYYLLLGVICVAQDRYGEATKMLSSAKELFENSGDKLRTAHCLRRLGDIDRIQGNHKEAQAMLIKARQLFDDIKDTEGSALCLRSLGDIAHMRDNHEEAKVFTTEAMDLFKKNGDRPAFAHCLQRLGNIARVQSSYKEASSLLYEAKGHFEAIGNTFEAANCLQKLGDIAFMQDNYKDAKRLLSEAMEQFKNFGSRRGSAQCLQRIGDIALAQSYYKEAGLALMDARESFNSIGDRHGSAQCLLSLGSLARAQGDYEDAMSKSLEAKSQFEGLDDFLGTAQCLQRIGHIARLQCDFDEARRNLQLAKEQFETIGKMHAAAQCSESLGDIALMQNKFVEATTT